MLLFLQLHQLNIFLKGLEGMRAGNAVTIETIQESGLHKKAGNKSDGGVYEDFEPVAFLSLFVHCAGRDGAEFIGL